MAQRLRRAGRALAVLTFVGLLAASLVGGPVAHAGALPSQITGGTPAATTAPGTPSTIAPLDGRLPVSPVTLPLRTRSSNAHVSPVFAYVSVAGFALAILIVLARMFLTRSGGPDRRPVPLEADGLD